MCRLEERNASSVIVLCSIISLDDIGWIVVSVCLWMLGLVYRVFGAQLGSALQVPVDTGHNIKTT